MRDFSKSRGTHRFESVEWVNRHKTLCGMDAAAERTRTDSPRVLWRLTHSALPRIIENMLGYEEAVRE